MLKILQARLQKYVNQEFPDVQVGSRKGIGTRDQIANIHWLIEKAREFQKNIYFGFIEYAKAFDFIEYTKAFDCEDHNKHCEDHKCRKFLRWEYQTILPASWEICMQVKKQQLEPDLNNGLVPNWERSMSRLYIVTLLIKLTCRVHHAKCWARWSTSWIQDCWDKY